MSIEEIHVERLQLKVPRSAVSADRSDGDRFARSVVAKLAESFGANGHEADGQSMKSLHVQVSRAQASSAAIAHAVHQSIDKRIGVTRKGR